MVRQKLNNQGFTFVELVIAVAILSIITVSIASFMATTSRVYSKTNYDSEVQSQAVEVYDQISSCIMQANKVIIYGYPSDGSGGFASMGNYYISDNLENVAGYDSSTGYLVDSSNNYVTKMFYNKAEDGSDENLNLFPIPFIYLKKDDGSGGQLLSELLVKSLYVEYQTKVGSDYETCYATFYISDDGDLYLNRHYTSDADISDYKPDESLANPPLAVIDKTVSATSVLCKTMKDEGFRVMVDAENNSIGLVLNFDNYSMTYDTLGMTKIRNNNVLTR